jgi:hypothetical protein
MMAETAFFFPGHPPEDWEIRRSGPYWVFRLKSWRGAGAGRGHRPSQTIRVPGHGQLNRRHEG